MPMRKTGPVASEDRCGETASGMRARCDGRVGAGDFRSLSLIALPFDAGVWRPGRSSLVPRPSGRHCLLSAEPIVAFQVQVALRER